MFNYSYILPSRLDGWFIQVTMKFKMFSTPSTLTLGFIQAIKQKSGGMVFQYFNFFSIFRHISLKIAHALYYWNKTLILQIHLSVIQDVGVYKVEHMLIVS